MKEPIPTVFTGLSPDIRQPVVCRHCGSGSLSWDARNTIGPSGLVQGRLTTNDVELQFFLGCDECSETLLVKRAADLAPLLHGGLSKRRAGQLDHQREAAIIADLIALRDRYDKEAEPLLSELGEIRSRRVNSGAY